MTFESALLIPVPEAEPLVGNLRTRYDPTATRGLPCHITVVYPFLDSDVLTPTVLGELTAIFAGAAPFRYTLQTIGRFPDVVYLAPEPNEPFLRLTAAVVTRWPAAPPYGGKYERVIPHLTVAHTSRPGEIESIREEIESSLPIRCDAHLVWLMRNVRDQWSIHHQFTLGSLAR